jgi:hypothetical protein
MKIHSIFTRAALASALVLGLSALWFSSGCLAVAAGAGAGAVAHVRRDLSATVARNADDKKIVIRAARMATA